MVGPIFISGEDPGANELEGVEKYHEKEGEYGSPHNKDGRE